MANAFRPVNFNSPNNSEAITTTTTTTATTTIGDMASPTTPRLPLGSQTQTQPEQPRPADDATTPTRASFHASLSSQKPLPTSPFPQTVQVPNSAMSGGLYKTEGSSSPADDDIEMDGSSNGQPEVGIDGHDDDIQEEPESDEDSPNADGERSNKKKKSQRFYCTDFPPCSLSFTRSEHLARHIRFVNTRGTQYTAVVSGMAAHC